MDQFMVPKSKEILNTAIATIAQSQVFLKVSVDGKELSQEDRIAVWYSLRCVSLRCILLTYSAPIGLFSWRMISSTR